MSWTNYHNHCHYCDGKETAENHVLAAIQQGVFSLGFSCHCPVPFENNWSMKKENLPAYLAEIERARNKFSDKIQVYTSLEIDYIQNMISPTDPWIQNLSLDYTIGSVHFVGAYENGRPWEIDGPHNVFLDGLDKIHGNDVESVVRKYYEYTRKMVKETTPDIVGHLDKIKMHNRRFWDEEASWYKNEVLGTLEEIKASGAIVEVNTRGLYKQLTEEPYPGSWILNQIHQMQIPIQINSDAHHPREITSRFDETLQQLQAIGFKELMVLHDGEWQPARISENSLVAY